MFTNRRFLQIISIVVILATMFSGFQLPPASAQGKGDGIKREVNAETGKVSFIGPESGQVLSASQALGSTLTLSKHPADPAMALAERFAPEFGVQNPKQDLKPMKSKETDNGRLTVRYQQNYEGIPVMGGELIVNTNDNGDLYSMNGEVSQNLSLPTQPTIDSAQAKDTALQAMAKWYQTSPSDFSASEPQLWIFDENLLKPSTRPTELVWRMDVTSKDESMPVRELVLVNAERGSISLHFNQIDEAWGETKPNTEISKLDITTPKVMDSKPTKDFMLNLSGNTWYVATTGDDSNDCATTTTPCATINGATEKAATSGDTIYVSEGTYTGNGFQVVLITKSVTILGGWNANFSTQSGYSTIDAGHLRRGIVVNSGTLGTVSIDRFVIKDGYASNADLSGEGGGGINIQYYSKLILTNSLIYGNKAVEGGGIFSSGADLTIINTTISYNYAVGGGGGAIVFLNYGSNNTLTIKNSTLSYNIAAAGGGIYIYDSGPTGAGGETISNTIIASNTSADGPDCRTTGGGINSADHNIIMNEGGCTMPPGSNSAVDPIMTPTLVGIPGYHALYSNSPAIDAGGNNCPANDQRGKPRPQGSACDIGAYEYPSTIPSVATSLAIIKGNNQRTLPGSIFPSALSIGLISINGDMVEQSGIQITLTAPSTGPTLVFANTGNHTSTITTDQYGTATSSLVTANSESGSYIVSATSNGLSSIDINVQNALWYVSPAGNNTNACDRPSIPCATINAVLAKPDFSDNDTIKVAEGTYTGNTGDGGYVVSINRSVNIIGGWDLGFNNQVGFSTIDGQSSRGGISAQTSLGTSSIISIDRFIIKKSNRGIASGNVTQFILSNSSVHSNSLGGIFLYRSPLVLNNVVISNNNNLGSYGGGIYMDTSNVAMNNVTISGNQAYAGGGIYQTGALSVQIANTIISGNTATASSPDCNGSITSSSHNIIGNTVECTITSGVGDQLNVNPKLGVFLPELGYHPLLPTSPAINAGDGCYGTTDQRGVERVGVCDIGAFEYVIPGPAASLSILRGNNQTTAPNSLFVNTLRVLALDNIGNPVEGVQVTFSAPANGPSAVFNSNNGNVATYMTDVSGVATTSAMKANNQLGSYFVEASAPGVGTSVNFSLENLAWYVAPTGLDTNSCKSPDFPCATIDGALAKMADGDKIYIATGVYRGSGYQVVSINKSVSLSGGWDLTFTNQTGLSVIDGQNVRNGVTVDSGVNVSLEKFIIKNGEGKEAGGGINNAGNLILNNTAITNNSAIYGGGIRNLGNLTLNNSTITGNTSSSLGGGIYNDNDGVVTLNNTTVSNNSTRRGGGGIYNSVENAANKFKIRNSIISGNAISTVQSSNGSDCIGRITSLGHNIIGFVAGCKIAASAGDKFNIDPKLATFLSALGYQPLKAGSPAINAGDSATCLPKDQRGQSRVGTCDMGAYEYKTPGAPAVISPVTIDLRIAPNSAVDEGIQAAVLDASGSPVNGGVIITFIAPETGASGLFVNGTHITSAKTNSSGIASSSTFTANSELGQYNVTASSAGIATNAELQLENFALFVSNSGDDSNDCLTSLTTCKNIQAAINKAVDGDTIYVAEGVYTKQIQFNSSGIIIDKDITIIGGMDETFSSYYQPSIIDGEMIYGGISNIATATLSGFIIKNNQTGIANSGSLTLREMSIISNDLGVYNYYSEGDLRIQNTTISNNHYGLRNNKGSVVINNSTIANNIDTRSDGQGGGILNVDGKVTILNSIVAGNKATKGPDCYNYDTDNYPNIPALMISNGNNIIGSITQCAIQSKTGDKFNTNPLLLPLLPTGYQPLQPTGPARNAGNPATCAPIDQRRVDRLADAKCDIGAYEYQIPGPAVKLLPINAYIQRTPINTSFPEKLQVVAVDGFGTPVGNVLVNFSAPSNGPAGVFNNTGTSSMSSLAGADGLATSSIFIANGQIGDYIVSATGNGIATPATFERHNGAWFVSADGGNNTNDCLSPLSPCATIMGVLGKTSFNPGETIWLTTGAIDLGDYLGSSTISKDSSIIGGWNSDFTNQDGVSTVSAWINIATGAHVDLRHLLIEGGGITNEGKLNLQDATVTQSDSGIRNTSYGDLALINVTVSGNTIGAAIKNDTGGYLSILNSTITNNKGLWVGGIENEHNGKVILKNTILVGNVATSSGAPESYDSGDCKGVFISQGNNIIGTRGTPTDGYGCYANWQNSDLVGNDSHPVQATDIMNTVLTLDLPSGQWIHKINFGSPAFDAISPSNCPATDQRGVNRPQGAACDIGAYEFTPQPILTKLSGSNQLAKIGTTFESPLRVYVQNVSGEPANGVSVTFTAPATGPSVIFTDSGLNYTTVISGSDGIATSPDLIANTEKGTYEVVAASIGFSDPVDFTLTNRATWYITPTGSDSNTCDTSTAPCASISGVLSKNVQDGDYIWMTIGTYGSAGDQVAVTINKSVDIEGGWDPDFTEQIGTSAIQDSIQINSNIGITLGKLTIQNTNTYGIENFANLTILDSTIRNNSNSGIKNNGQLTVINSTITQNGTENVSDHGGIDSGYIELESTVLIYNSTITKNTGSVGAVGNGGNLPIRIRNTIIAGNIATEGKPVSPDCLGSFISEGNNIIGNIGNIVSPICQANWTSTDLVGSYLYNQNGKFLGDKSVDPMLDLIQDLGNDIWVHPLKLGSPAINKVEIGNCPAADQRSVIRPQGALCDVGAVEYEFNHDPDNPIVTTYNAQNGSSLPGSFICDQTAPTCPLGDSQAKNAHQYAIGVYDFYKDKFNRNSIDNNGIEIISTVHFSSGYDNAFWNGYMMIYGDANGYPLADDIVAHELTHGVTQYESNLFYFYQSGAINESLSDVFGEYYDQTNGLGNDSSAVKWLIGEDVSGLGAFRNMKNPPQFGDPDKMTSAKYSKGIADSGGVHRNSGVNNKAAFLMVDGGTFNGKTVTGIGWDKTAAIYYEANTNLLTSGSDYSDLYFALLQACSNLTGQIGITSDDCIQVNNALLAVEMNKQPASNFNPVAPLCPSGLSTGDSLSLFKDDLESGEANWTKTGSPKNAWSLDNGYATSPTHMFYGDDSHKSTNSSLIMSSPVSLPTGSKALLHFDHAFLFDYGIYQGAKYYFDGGVLEYSLDNGKTWKDAKPLFSAGQNYKGTISSYTGTTNNLKGRPAFVGDSHGYVSSRYNLSSLAGKTVQFRWRLGTDWTVSFLGWFVDDVQIYTCIPNPSKPVLKTPASNALVTDYTPDLDWSNSTPAPDHYQLQIATDSKFKSLVYDETSLPASNFTVPSDLDPNTTYYWRARAFNAINKSGSWSTPFYFRTVMSPPVLLTPTDGETIASLQPLLDWDDVAGATKYTVQVSAVSDFSTKLVNATSTGSTYQVASNLPSGVTLYWRVRATGPNGPSDWSTLSFTTP